MTVLEPGVHLLWPTPIGLYRYDRAGTINAALVEEFAGIREDQERQRGVPAGAPFFASDDAAFVTGQVLSVSGGLTMAG